MKLDLKIFLEFIRTFGANLAVASFVLAIFEKINLGFLVGSIFFCISFITCLKRKRGD